MIKNTKHFLENCSEVDAKIEEYLAYYESKNYSRKEGTETGFRIKFSYKFNNENYIKGYSISRNKHTVNYLDKYKK